MTLKANALIKLVPSNLGATPTSPYSQLDGVCIDPNKIPATTNILALHGLMGMAGSGLCAYHGWKRNESYGWTVLWSIFGGVLPPLAVLIALLQGFGKKA